MQAQTRKKKRKKQYSGRRIFNFRSLHQEITAV